MSKIKPQQIKVGRPLTCTEITLANGIVLVAVPLDKTKGRHWIAQKEIGGLWITVGEFKSWQKSKYTRPDELGAEGFLRSEQQYRSWINDPETIDTKRHRQEWQNELKKL